MAIATVMSIVTASDLALGSPTPRHQNCARKVEAAVLRPEVLVAVLAGNFPGIEDWDTLWTMYSAEDDGERRFADAVADLLLAAGDLETLSGLSANARKIILEARGLADTYGDAAVKAELPLYVVLNALDMSRPTNVAASYPLPWFRGRVAARFSSTWRPTAIQHEAEEFDTGSETARSKLFGGDGIKKHNVRPLRSQDVRVISPASE